MVGRNVKVLLVDDEPIARRSVSRLIWSLGMVPIEASDGARALAILEDNQDIALVVTDMIMPICDGRKLLLEMVGRGLMPRIPVIILSGLLSFSEVRDLVELGEVRFAAKPFDRATVEGYIVSLLSKRQMIGGETHEHASGI